MSTSASQASQSQSEALIMPTPATNGPRRGSAQSGVRPRLSPGIFEIELADYSSSSDSASASDSGSNSLQNSQSTYSADTFTAIGTPTEEAKDPNSNSEGRQVARARQGAAGVTSSPAVPTIATATPVGLHASHLSHLSHLSQHTPSHATDATDKPHVLESITDLVSRVEAWRGDMVCSGPTNLKRNKAYVGLWALGVQDLLANPVLVTAMSSPAGSHFESRR